MELQTCPARPLAQEVEEHEFSPSITHSFKDRSPTDAANPVESPHRFYLAPATPTLPQPTRPNRVTLKSLIDSFLNEHLAVGQAASRHTIRAYRQTLDLFQRFLSGRDRSALDEVDVRHLSPDALTGFVAGLEGDRKNRPSTLNARIAALRTFARFVQHHEPSVAGSFGPILRLAHRPLCDRPSTCLGHDEFNQFLASISVESPSGCRDAALLRTLYDTGARISEVLELRWSDLSGSAPGTVTFRARRRGSQICGLSPETLQCLLHLRTQTQAPLDSHIFLNSQGTPLTRDGAAYLLRTRYQEARAAFPTLPDIRLHPHSLRRSRTSELRREGRRASAICHQLGLARVPR